jgi:hypothetical protein
MVCGQCPPYISALIDVAGSLYGAKNLWSIYQGAKQQAALRRGANQPPSGYERPIAQEFPLLNGSGDNAGQIVTNAGSLAPATTPPGWSRGFDGALVASPGLMLSGITKKFTPIPGISVGMNPAHSVNTIKVDTDFGGGKSKTVAIGEVNTGTDITEIQNGMAVRLNNGDILTSSGRIYGIHTDGNNRVFIRAGSPGTIELTKGEFKLYTLMLKSGGLQGKALQFYENTMSINKPSGLDFNSPQKLINLYDSRQ